MRCTGFNLAFVGLKSQVFDAPTGVYFSMVFLGLRLRLGVWVSDRWLMAKPKIVWRTSIVSLACDIIG